MKPIICELCESEFLRRYDYEKHISRRTACITSKQALKLLKQIQKLERKLNGEETDSDEEIEIKNLEDTDVEVINRKDIFQYHYMNADLWQEMFKKVWLNNKKKENQNILVESISNKFCKVYDSDNKDWLVILWNEVYDKMTEFIIDRMETFIDTAETDAERIKLETRVESMKDTLLEEIDLKDKVRCLFYNNRNLVKVNSNF